MATTTIFTAFFSFVLLTVAELPLPPPPLQPPGCLAELVAFSPCLSFVSDPPNNDTDLVPPVCCSAFSSAFKSGDGYCFCYIVRQPMIFGFPLNQSRVASLSSYCNCTHDLHSLCFSGAPALPPLGSTTDSGISIWKPFYSGSDNDSSGLTSSPPEYPVRSPSPPKSPVIPAIYSSAANQIYRHKSWLLLGPMILQIN